MKENHLRLFGHVQGHSLSQPVRKIQSWGSEDLRRGRGRVEDRR